MRGSGHNGWPGLYLQLGSGGCSPEAALAGFCLVFYCGGSLVITQSLPGGNGERSNWLRRKEKDSKINHIPHTRGQLMKLKLYEQAHTCV